MNRTGTLEFSSSVQQDSREALTQCLLDNIPLPRNQILSNLGLFLLSKDLSRILFMDHIYRQILSVPGVVFDFGTRWGNNMAIFSALRGIYEPYNRHRLVVGFDTFEGFPEISSEDGNSSLMERGNVSTTPEYEKYLKRVLQCHENFDPLSHIRKFDIRKGDATRELDLYLKENPQTIVSLAYFDFDLYTPTKYCLEMIREHLVNGSIVAFDELNDKDSPGETVALREVFGLGNLKLRRLSTTTRTSYFVYEGQSLR